MAYSVEFGSTERRPTAADNYLAMDGEADALRQARVYLQAGFHVYCIKDDAGKIVLSQEQIREMFQSRS